MMFRFLYSSTLGALLGVLMIQVSVTGMPVTYAQAPQTATSTSSTREQTRQLLQPLVRFENRELTVAGQRKLRQELRERRARIQNDAENTEQQKQAGKEFEEVNRGTRTIQSLSKGALLQAAHVGQTYLFITLLAALENERMVAQSEWDSGAKIDRDKLKEFGLIMKMLTQDGALASGMAGAFTFSAALKPVTYTIDRVYLNAIKNQTFRGLMNSGIATTITFVGWEFGRELWTEAKLMLDDEDYAIAQGDYYTFGSFLRMYMLPKSAAYVGGPWNSALRDDPKRMAVFKKIFENMAFIVFNDPDRRELFLYNVFRHNILNGDFMTLVATFTVTSTIGGLVGSAATPVVGTILGWIIGFAIGFLGGVVWLYIPRETKDDITLGFKTMRWATSVAALRADREKFMARMKENKFLDREYFHHVLGGDPDYNKAFDRRNTRDQSLEDMNTIIVYLKQRAERKFDIPQQKITSKLPQKSEDIDSDSFWSVDPLESIMEEDYEETIDGWIKQEYANLDYPERAVVVEYPDVVMKQKIQQLARLMTTSASLKKTFKDRISLRNHMMYQFPDFYTELTKFEPVYSGKEKALRDELIKAGYSKRLVDAWVKYEYYKLAAPNTDATVKYPSKDVERKAQQIASLAEESILMSEFFNRRQGSRERMIDAMVEYVNVNSKFQQVDMNRAEVLRKYLDDWIVGSSITKEQLNEWLKIEFQKRYYPGTSYADQEVLYPHQVLKERVPLVAELVVRSIKRAQVFSDMVDQMLEVFKEETALYADLIRKFTLAKTHLKINQMNKESGASPFPVDWGVFVKDPDRMLSELAKELNHFQRMKDFYIALFLGLTPDKESLRKALDFQPKDSDFEVLYELKLNAQTIEDAKAQEELDLLDTSSSEFGYKSKLAPTIDETIEAVQNIAEAVDTTASKTFGKDFVSGMMKAMYKQTSMGIIHQLNYESVKEDKIIYYTSFE